MGRPRKNPLPPGIHERRYRSGRRTYSIDFRTADGARVQEKAGDSIDDAVRLLRQRRAEVEAGTYGRDGGTGEQTIATYAHRWIALRRADGVRSVDDEERAIRLHVVPHLGARRLSELRPRDVAAWVRELGRGELSPKSILNVHGVLSSMLGRARFDELIADNPARNLPRGILPKNVRSREVGAWSREEIETLISDERIPEDRRVAYAIAAFTGARVGEVAGLRWRDLDTAARPLWRWVLRTQYDGAPLKTDHPRDVPIHPQLQRVLSAWKVGGWARFMARGAPSPDDFVVPRCPQSDRRPHAKRTAWHSDQSLGAKAIQAHAARVGVDPTGRDFHSLRRGMITLARTDGARVEILERITHNSAGAMIDAYTYFGWEDVCAAVCACESRSAGALGCCLFGGRVVTHPVTRGGPGRLTCRNRSRLKRPQREPLSRTATKSLRIWSCRRSRWRLTSRSLGSPGSSPAKGRALFWIRTARSPV